MPNTVFEIPLAGGSKIGLNSGRLLILVDQTFDYEPTHSPALLFGF